MLHIQPVSEQDASESIRTVFSEINTTLKVPIVPLLFRYLANYESYLPYLWHHLKTNINSAYFQEAYKSVNKYTYEHIQDIYHPSKEIRHFFDQLSSEEKQQIHTTIAHLEQVNAQLFLLTLGIREGVKGVFVGQEEVSYLGDKKNGVDEILGSVIQDTKIKEDQNMTIVNHLLAPLFGSSSIMVIRYPEFFVNIAREMDTLMKKESYLSKRVLLEQMGLHFVSGLQYSLGTSYQEIAHFASGKPYFNELLYILSDTFPSQFPRLVMTTQMMRYIFNQGGKTSDKI